MKKISILTLIVLFSLTNTVTSQTVTKTLEAAKDNTIFNDSDFIKSNGSGDFLFSGKTDDGFLRRALIQFNLVAIPQSATIDSAVLKLTVSKSIFEDADASIYTLTSDWGEGNSDGPGQEGKGDTAITGDATWWETYFGETAWTTSGGDFNATASATAPVPSSGTVNFMSAQLTADINDWLATPEGNFGWIILTDETQNKTAKRFFSKEFDTKSKRPKLILYYENPAGRGDSDLNPDKSVQLLHNNNSGEYFLMSELAEKSYHVKIFSITGMEVYKEEKYLFRGRNTIYPEITTPGIYLVTVKDEANTYASKNLVH